MSRGSRVRRAIFALAVVLGSLAAVAWRQSTTRETMEALDQAERELAIVLDEREEVARDLVDVESWGWVFEQAVRRLDLRPATQGEVIITSGGSR